MLDIEERRNIYKYLQNLITWYISRGPDLWYTTYCTIEYLFFHLCVCVYIS